MSMLDKPKKLRIFTESGPLIALAIAIGVVLGFAGPSSAQFFNFGGFQQRPQPQRGGGGWAMPMVLQLPIIIDDLELHPVDDELPKLPVVPAPEMVK